MIRRTILRITKRILPNNSLLRRVLKKLAIRLGLISPFYADGRYREWVVSTEKMFWTPQRDLGYKPLISIIVPVFNAPEEYLLEAVYSVVNQTYGNWELLLVNASTLKVTRDATVSCGNIDSRIKVVDIHKNLGIAGNTNIGIKHATGEYIALLDNDDTLAPEALYEVACELQGSDKPDFLYSDEDKISPDSEQRFDPHFKAGWSLHTMRQVNYLNHLTVLNAGMLKKAGGYQPGFEGAQDYDLYLRVIDAGAIVKHIPKILYHWRAIATSTAANFSSKDNVLTAGKKALSDHLSRNGLQGEVTSIDNQPGFYDITYKASALEVAIVILPSTDSQQYAEYTRQLMRLVSGVKGVHVYICNLKANKKMLSMYENVLTSVHADSTEEYLTKVKNVSTAETMVFLGAALLWNEEDDWLERVAGFLGQCLDVDVVVPLIIDELSNRIIDAGSVKIGATEMPLFVGYPVGAHTFLGNSTWTRHLDRCSGRCIVVRKEAAAKIVASNPSSIEDIARAVTEFSRETILWPRTKLNYAGDFRTVFTGGNDIMPIFCFSHQELSFDKSTYYIPSGADNA